MLFEIFRKRNTEISMKLEGRREKMSNKNIYINVTFNIKTKKGRYAYE